MSGDGDKAAQIGRYAPSCRSSPTALRILTHSATASEPKIILPVVTGCRWWREVLRTQAMANAPRAEDSVEERLRLIEKAASSA